MNIINPIIVVVITVVLFFLNSLIFKKIDLKNSKGSKGIISFFLLLISLVMFILVLPIDKSSKSQILSLMGIVISAGIALSSTTILGNLIAGFMNNSIGNFKNGNLIEFGNFKGRIIKKGIFHTELQLDDSNFVNIPNLQLANNPIKLIRKSNTIVSTSVSLGYEISHEKIVQSLKDAAILTDLKNPYVYITSLGDFSVLYKIHGFLEDNSKYFSTKSLLNSNVIDKLHNNNIEIVSPNFMNQRRVDNQEFIPREKFIPKEESNQKLPEKLIFDEAIKSEKLEVKKDYLKTIDEKLLAFKEKLKSSNDEYETINLEFLINRNERLKERIEKNIENLEKDLIN